MQWRSKMLQRRGSSFRNGSESGGKLFWTAREEGKLAKLTSKKKKKTKTKTKTKTKQKIKIKTNKQKVFKSLGSLLHFALLQKNAATNTKCVLKCSEVHSRLRRLQVDPC